jgi:hypothetical protein
MHTEVVFALVSSRTLFWVDGRRFQPQLRLLLEDLLRASRDETLPEQICWHRQRVPCSSDALVKLVHHNNGVTK